MATQIKKNRNYSYQIGAILCLAFVTRIVLLCVTKGYSADVSCFAAWALRMADLGPAGFYAPDYFADYPPAYMLALWPAGKIISLFDLPYDSGLAALALGVIPVICDIVSALLIGQIAKQYAGPKAGAMFTACAAFCPALLYDTGVWKQIDGVLCLLMVACFWLLMKNRRLAAAVVFGLALAVKPQPLLLGPVFAVCYVVAAFQDKKPKQILKEIGITLLAALLAVGTIALLGVPFGANQPAGWLLDKYTNTVTSYPYASVNGFNLIALLGGNWKPQEDAVIGGITWELLGNIGIVLSTVALLWLSFRGAKNRRFCPLLMAAFYGAAIFTLAHRMHERYVLPTVLLTLAAAARWGDRRLLGGFWMLSLSSLLNQGMVLTSNGTEDQFMTASDSVIMIRIISVMALAGFALICWAAFDLTGKEKKVRLCTRLPLPAPGAQPAWSAKEGAFLAVVTIVTAIYSIVGLGDTTAPQTPFDAIGTVSDETLLLQEPAGELWLYTGVTWDGGATLLDENGQEIAQMKLTTQSAFKWQNMYAPELQPGTYKIKAENCQLMEAAFVRADGSLAAATGDGALLDEQLLVPEHFSFKNTTYFDEIYHGRTAYEHLHGMTVYETTHPPLGKVFIMLGVALFGMTGFGWRISGTLFGIAMVPVMYLFVRRLTRSRFAAGLSAVLLALDGMRFAQSRISTIDVYGTFFILLSAYFMVWYCQSVLEKGVSNSILPMALTGIAFGLGAASKWTGIYAGAGLAVLYFGVLWQRYQQKQKGFQKELLTALGGGVLFFVCVPLVLYIGAYFPYYWREGGFSLAEWWQCQLGMFRYHSTLVAPHPYESRWYSWPFAVKPVWYNLDSGTAEGLRSSISGMGNPLVWWAGALCIGMTLWRQFSGRASRGGGALTVLYLTQLLPWVLVARSTFMYHYFPSLVFAVAAIGLVFAQWYRKQPKAAVITAAVLVGAALIVFVCFYPVYSGMPANSDWIEGLRWFKSWVF